jgi:hypothetical protein
MPKCELCDQFDSKPRLIESEDGHTGIWGWCNKFDEPRRMSDSCNAGESVPETR